MFKKVGDLVMAQLISSRIEQVQRYIREHPADAFSLGVIYGMLNEIRKDAEEQEESYSTLCQLYFPSVLNDTVELIVDILKKEETIDKKVLCR